MPIQVTCACGKTLEVPDEHRGKRAKCPVCGNVFVAELAPVQATPPPLPTSALPEESAPEPARPVEAPAPPPKSMLPWIIVGLLGVLTVCGCLPCGAGGVWYFARSGLKDAAKKELAQAQVNGPLTQACLTFQVRHNRVPDNLDELVRPDAFGAVFLKDPGQLIDPWGRPYSYDPFGDRNDGLRPDIWTIAPDGTTIGNWPRGR